MRAVALALSVAALLAAPAAQAMSVAEFLARARQLQAVGVLAPLYDDYALLRGELRAIDRVYRGELAAARAAGRPPHSCPPPEPPRMTGEQLIRELERIPPAQRGVSMRAAFYAFMKRHYPCR